MALASDKEGFLTTPSADAEEDQALSVWRSIKGDTAAMRASLANESTRASKSFAAPLQQTNTQISKLVQAVSRQRVSTPSVRERDALGRFVKPSGAQESRESSVRSALLSAPKGEKALVERIAGKKAVTPGSVPDRNNDGRFRGDSEDVSGGRFGRTTELLGDAAGKLASAVDGTEQIDPSIQAAGEIKSLVAPVAETAVSMGKGLFGFFRKDKDEETESVPWYKRIVKELKKLNGDSGTASGGGFMSRMMASLSGVFSGILPMLGMLFTRVLGPIAAVIGAWKVGQWVGEKIHGWLVSSGLQDKIFDAFDSIKENIGETWKTVTDGFGSLVKSMRESWDSVTGWFGEKKDKVVGAVKQGVQATKDTASQAGKYVGEKATAAKDWFLGKTSKTFESGNKGSAAVSSGKGDFGGASYGTYQLSSKQGQVQKFLKNSKYGDQFAGLQPGSAAFNAKWQEVAKNDPGFGDAQHDYIKATHYDPQMAKLKESGMDLSGRGAAVKDAMWSTSVQYGNKTSGIFKNALKGKDVSKLTDAEITSAVQAYKLRNVDKHFASSSQNVKAGVKNRIVAENEKLINLAATSAVPAVSSAPSIPQVPSAAPDMAKMQPPPAPSPAPTKVGSSDKGGNGQTVIIDRGVGQDVPDRRLAQVVTGGLGGYGGYRG